MYIIWASVRAPREREVTAAFVNARPGGPARDPVITLFFGPFQ